MAKPQKRLVLVLGDKGGTGKSTVAKLIWERLRANPAARAFDADGTTGSFAAIYGEYDAHGDLVVPQPASGVTPLSLHGTDRERDRGLTRALETDADVVLIDMPATSLTVLQKVEAEWGFLADAGRAGYKVTTVNVVSPYYASLMNVTQTFTLAPNADAVVVLNEVHGDDDDYLLWHGDPALDQPESAGKQQLKARGGIEVVLPRVASRPLVLADLWALTYGQALEDARIERHDRNRLRRWLEDSYDAMLPATEILGLTMPKAASNGKSAKPEPVSAGTESVS